MNINNLKARKLYNLVFRFL